MGLLQNISIKNAEPYDRTGGSSEFWPMQLNWGMNKFVSSAGISQKSGLPDGYAPPYSFLMPIKEGGMSSFLQMIGEGEISDNSYMATVKSFPLPEGGSIVGVGTVSNISSLSSLMWLTLLTALSGSGEVDNTSDLKSYTFLNTIITGSGEVDSLSSFVGLVWILSNLTGSGQINDSLLLLITSMSSEIISTGEISEASITLFMNMITNITGSGEIDNTSVLKALAVISSLLVGSGQVDNSPLKLFAWCLSNLSGVGSINAVMKGWADMSAEISSSGEVVTAQSCAQAVWNALAASYDTPGTMGQKLNAAGTAGDPWTAVLSDYVEGTAGDFINSIMKLTGYKVTKSGDIITIYEKDGITIWRQYNLSSGGREQV